MTASARVVRPPGVPTVIKPSLQSGAGDGGRRWRQMWRLKPGKHCATASMRQLAVRFFLIRFLITVSNHQAGQLLPDLAVDGAGGVRSSHEF